MLTDSVPPPPTLPPRRHGRARPSRPHSFHPPLESAATLDRAVGADSGQDSTRTVPSSGWVIPLALGVLAFVVHAWIAVRLDRMGVFDDADVLFQSDINYRLTEMAHAMFTGSDVRHPNFGLFVSPLVRALTWAPARFVVHPRTADALYALRERVALLLVSPLAGAVRTATLYRIVRRLGAAVWSAALVALVDLFAFGSLLLGSIPESFPLTAACTAVLCWFVLDDRPHSGRRTALWVAIGALAVGVTSSNLATVGLLVACVALRRLGPDWRAWTGARALVPVRWATLVLAGVVAVNGLGLAFTSRVLHRPVATRTPPGQSYLHGQPVRAAAELALAFGNTFVAPAPTVRPNGTQRYTGPQLYTRRFSVNNISHGLTYPFPTPAGLGIAQGWRAGLVWLALLAGGAALAAATRRDWAGRMLLVAVLALIAWNVALHLVFGHEFLLYSQHWAPLMAVLLAGLVVVRGRWQPAASAGLVLFATVVAVDAPHRVTAILHLLPTMR